MGIHANPEGGRFHRKNKMPLGIVSDEEFESELQGILPEGKVIEKPDAGRGNAEGVPESVRKIISDEAQENSRAGALELGKFFGVSPSSVSAYANGACSTASYDKPSAFKDYVAAKRKKITKRAAKGISRALEHITDDKLHESSASELASVARALSGVVKDMEPPTGHASGTSVQFIIHAPQIIKEDKFDVIDVVE